MGRFTAMQNILANPAVFELALEYFGINQPEPLYKVICPFHADRNASLQINKEKCFWYCYGCHAKGNALDLVHNFKPKWSELKCLLFLQKLAKHNINKYNINIYNIAPTSSVKTVSFVASIKLSKSYYDTLPSVNWYKPRNNQSNAEEAAECLAYMRARGFTPRLLKLCGAKPSLNPKYPICIPLLECGKFMGYVLRTFDKQIEQERKYMYNRGFRRERTLAGNIVGNSILLVEGYLDCLKAQQFGIKSVAAILGWKISNTQFKKLQKHGISKVYCGLDNDEAGRKGYNYLKLVCKQTGIKVVRIRYPKGVKDFGDLKAKTKELEIVLNQLGGI